MREKVEEMIQKNSHVKEWLSDYELFSDFRSQMMNREHSTIHQNQILLTLFNYLNLEQNKKYFGLFRGVYLKVDFETFESRKVSSYYKNNYTKDYFLLGNEITSFEDFKKQFDSFSALKTFNIYANKKTGQLRFVMILNEYYAGTNGYYSMFIFDYHLVEEESLNKESMFFKYKEKLIELNAAYKSELFSIEIYKRGYYTQDNEREYNSLKMKEVWENSQTFNKEKLFLMDISKIKYFVYIKDENVYCYFKEFPYISTRVLNLCIESNFTITNTQANLLNHFLGRKIYLTNGEGALFYNPKDRGIGWDHDREWVQKQLQPFIKSGLIKFEKVVAPRDARYRIWYFYENIEGVNADNLKGKGFDYWQGNFKGDVV